MSHDLVLSSRGEEFPLVGNPDADAPGLGRHRVFGGDPGAVVAWYERHCRGLNWTADDWTGRAGLDESCAPPDWARPDPVERHIAMVDAFLAFADGARFGAS